MGIETRGVPYTKHPCNTDVWSVYELHACDLLQSVSLVRLHTDAPCRAALSVPSSGNWVDCLVITTGASMSDLQQQAVALVREYGYERREEPFKLADTGG